jgi:hypothetical protein
MDELIKTVVGKTGLTDDVVKQVVEQVIAFLKEKLPEPLAGQLDNVLGMVDQNKDGNIIDDIKKGIGGLFGGKS